VTLTLELDDLDAAAVNEAIAKRQRFRDESGCILPDTESNTAGVLIAEICRGWMEYRERSDRGEGEEWKRAGGER